MPATLAAEIREIARTLTTRQLEICERRAAFIARQGSVAAEIEANIYRSELESR